MGKRSNMKRKASDLYRTPMSAVLPLLPHIRDVKHFAEPCAANGLLVDHLRRHGKTATWISDLIPGRGDVMQFDALCMYYLPNRYLRETTHIITNPPWDRKILHPMIERFASLRPTWLLFDSDWIHTKQSIPYMPYLAKVVSVGRAKWIPGSPTVGKDNCAWHLFDMNYTGGTEFHGRAK